MAWSWSHTPQAYADAEANLRDLEPSILAEIAAEWDTHAHDAEAFDSGYFARRRTFHANTPADVLADYIWERANDQRSCDNGGFNAWMCPFGCGPHCVPFDRYDARLVEAEAAGRDHGKAAGSWVIDGNTSDDDCRRILRGLDDGDPEVMDSLPSAPLSGEWADDPTPASVLADLGTTEDDDASDDYLNAYEDGFAEAVIAEVSGSCLARLGPPIDPDRFPLDRAYMVSDYPGVAFRIDEVDRDVLRMHMIGDDRTFTYGPDDVLLLERGTYCLECGQIGCSCSTDAGEKD